MAESRTRDQLVRRSLRASKILCFVTLAFPAMTAVGWIFGIAWMTQGHPTLPVMHANTAAGLALAAVAVLLTPERPSMCRRTSIALLLASAILLLGLLTLGEYIFGWDVGIDRIFAHDAPSASQPFPGRPSPQTSLNFVLLGGVLFSFNLGWPMQIGQIGAIVVAANAIAAVTGYVFTARTFYGFPVHTAETGMAVHTAISFMLLVAALLCRRPNDGMMTLVTSETHAGRMARRILLAGIVAPPFVGVLTHLGVAAGLYDVSTEGSLFVLVLAALILRTTWGAARRSEHEERQTQAALAALERANNALNRAVGERQVFAALVENSSDFIGIADATGHPIYLNPAGRRMVGLPPDFPVGSTAIADYYPPDQRTFASEVILKSMVQSGHWEGETAFRHWQTEEAIPVSDTHFMIREPETGRIIGMGTVTRDISEIKRAREEMEAVVDQMPEGIVLMDAEGRVTMENQALRVLTNVRPPVPDRFGNPMTIDLRHPSGESVAPDDLPIVKAMVDKEITWGQEFIGRRVDGRLMPFLVSAAPILTAERRLAGAVMVFQDISALKELERIREEWASIIAHDLRQPISVIALRSALLQRARLSDDHQNDVRQIHAAAERLSRMTSDLMDASLLETRRMQVALERLDLCQFLRDVVQRVPLGASRTTIRAPAGIRLFIRADAQRLEQVMANLLSNAVKYGAPGTDIGLEVRQAPGNAEILVTNRGAGIPPDELPLLFDRYVRSRTAETGTTRGLGLGLYIARGLVEAHQGHIWAESVPGDVTTFHVVIPLDGPPVPAEAPALDEAGACPELQGVRS